MLQKYPMYSYLPAKDIARAKRFHEEKLGVRATEEVAGGVVYAFGEQTACFLYPTPNARSSKASQAFWQVEDVEREVAELKALGGEFEDYDMPGERSENGIVTAGGAKAVWFRDSECNILALVQSLSKARCARRTGRRCATAGSLSVCRTSCVRDLTLLAAALAL